MLCRAMMAKGKQTSTFSTFVQMKPVLVVAFVIFIQQLCMTNAIYPNALRSQHQPEIVSERLKEFQHRQYDEFVAKKVTVLASPTQEISQKSGRMNQLVRRMQQAGSTVNELLDELQHGTALSGIVDSPKDALHVISSTDDNKSDEKPNNLINDYLSKIYNRNNMVLMKWNSSGILERISPINEPNWLGTDDVQNLFKKTQPSEFGTVALLMNSDIIDSVPFDIEPPIPLILYSLPYKVEHSPMYSIVPSPYDRSGFNEYSVNVVLWYLSDTYGAETPTYEQYHSRSPVAVWRGTCHNDNEFSRIRLLEMSYPEKWLLANSVTSSLPESEGTLPCNDNPDCWLDAIDVTKHPAMVVSTKNLTAHYKYQIDIGGVSGTSWGGLRWKLCTGNLVFKVDSWAKDWWHDYIEPYKHYLPVKEDLSDLKEKYDWAESHPKEVYDIVFAAQTECLRTYRSEASMEQTLHVMQTSIPPSNAEMVRQTDEIFDHYIEKFFHHRRQ